MSSDIFEMRKALRAGPKAQEYSQQARKTVGTAFKPMLEQPFGSAPVRVERMRGGPNAFGPVETTTMDALAPLNFAA